MDISWEELIWALISVGKRNRQEIYLHGIYSSFDIISKYSLVLSTLKQDSNEGFIKTNIYKAMDATEKSMVSYNMGMLCSKLAMSKLFDTPWLMHLSNVENIEVWKKTKSRPDLVGFDRRGDWVVAEAKGRSNKFDAKALRAAKKQTRTIKSINGSYPSLKVATESYFDDQLKVALHDPEEFDDDAVDLKIDINEYLKKYYSHISFLTKDSHLLPENIGIHIKLAEVLQDAINENDYKMLLENQDELHSPDGIIIKLDPKIWNKSNLSLNPEDRAFTPS